MAAARSSVLFYNTSMICSVMSIGHVGQNRITILLTGNFDKDQILLLVSWHEAGSIGDRGFSWRKAGDGQRIFGALISKTTKQYPLGQLCTNPVLVTLFH